MFSYFRLWCTKFWPIPNQLQAWDASDLDVAVKPFGFMKPLPDQETFVFKIGGIGPQFITIKSCKNDFRTLNHCIWVPNFHTPTNFGSRPGEMQTTRAWPRNRRGATTKKITEICHQRISVKKMNDPTKITYDRHSLQHLDSDTAREGFSRERFQEPNCWAGNILTGGWSGWM